tara:strand:- start:762 stop:1034 length:273 start_codon:yes stop_codon:yes gene_type:complete
MNTVLNGNHFYEYAGEADTLTVTLADHSYINCLCCVCQLPLASSDDLADKKVFDFDGSLDSIETAHKSCALAEVREHGNPTTFRLGAWEL